MSSLVEEARTLLARQGGRMTAQRRLILETLDASSGHPTAEELYEMIRPLRPDLNLSTVYRTLRWLEQEGLVGSSRFKEDSRSDRFDPAYPSEHHHFVCSACGQVIEFNDPEIERIKQRFEQVYSAQVETASVVFYGLCEGCCREKPVEPPDEEMSSDALSSLCFTG